MNSVAMLPCDPEAKGRERKGKREALGKGRQEGRGRGGAAPPKREKHLRG